MNDIFNTDVPLKTETTAFAKHVLPAVPLSEVYLEDCVTALKRYADNHFDLAIVDPPYGLGIDGQKLNNTNKNPKHNRKAHSFKGWDNAIPNAEYFSELKRVSKNQIVWGGNYFPFLWQNGCKGFVFWYKGNPVPNFADGELAYTSFNKVAKCFDFQYYGGLEGNTKASTKIHPTQKPVKLYQWLLHNYSEKGQKILDTHLGSGSIAVAAHYFGVDLVGVEIDEEYYNKAKERVNELTKQTTMF